MEIFNFEGMLLWQWLVAAGAFLILAEAIIPGFFAMPLGIGLIFTGLVAIFTDNHVVILAALVVFEVASVIYLRRVLKKLIGNTKLVSNADGMIGQEAIVTEEIEAGGTGYVKLYGDRWMARSFSEKKLGVGKKVVITKLDGNKVWVDPMHE
jgi:membrane protein implicated in regulation of membrane protease activity